MSTNPNPVKIQNTIRDVNQSNFAGVLSAEEMTTAEAHAEDVGYSSIQGGGGTFFHKPMMEGRDPWDEFRTMREAYPDTPLSILVRGDTLVGYDDNPDDVIEAYVKQSAEAGVDIFTIFDGFNDTRKQTKVIEEVKKQGKHAQGVICVADSEAYTMEMYKQTARELYEAGADSFYIKDPVGVAPPEDVYELTKWLKEEFPEKEVHVHAHNTHGMAYAIYMAAIEAGADTIDCGHPATSENVAQPSVLRLIEMIENHPNPEVRARAPQLNLDAIEADRPALNALHFQYRDFEPSFNKEVFDAMRAAKAPGGAASTLKGMVHPSTSAMMGLEWDDAQIAIYRVQEKLLPLLGDPMQVTPHAKNTTTQAAQILLHFVADKEHGPEIQKLKKQPNGSQEVLKYVTDVLNDDSRTPSQGRGYIGRGEAFIISAIHAKMTTDIAKYMSGRLGRIPGEVDQGLADTTKVKEQALPEDQKDARPASLIPPRVDKAVADLEAAGFTDVSADDVVTVALWDNGKREGFTHVSKKLNGELVSNPAPELPKYAQDEGYEPYYKNGIEVKTKYDVYEALGGAAVIEGVAQAVLEQEKRSHYKAHTPEIDADKRAGAAFYAEHFDAWSDEAREQLEEYIEHIPQLLYDEGFETVQMSRAVAMANEIIADACQAKCVSAKAVPEAAYVPGTLDVHRSRDAGGVEVHEMA